ncbi:MAG: hypothetical protein B2I17_09115 [Thermoplasmatales archaeon B_DKE]|nr:MAG: hypothetical protein B2I17_09115 [Thermoplasmatales archaeon B_DKE]
MRSRWYTLKHEKRLQLSKKDAELIARDRIKSLVELAAASHEMEPRYIALAESIARRMDITLPQSIKRSYCKRCKHLYDGKSRMRIKKGIVTITCSHCSDVRRLPYRPG